MKLTRDVAWWLLCWSCYRLYLLWPVNLMPTGWELKLLPFAGIYAYSDTWADFRDTVQWNVDGRPSRGTPARRAALSLKGNEK